MKKRYAALAVLGIVGVGIGAAAYVASPTIHEGTVGESPELGRVGEHSVGTMVMRYTLADRPTFAKLGMATGQIELVDRDLSVRLWYPAQPGGGAAPITYTHTMAPPGVDPIPLEFAGRAVPQAEPVTDVNYPLVIMSHGFNGWHTQWSQLGEHIASHGYVVASIEHADMNIEGPADFLHSFARVLIDRSLDQRGVLKALLTNARVGNGPVYNLIDPDRTALIGYSMGGFGAIATAGGGYDYDSDTMGTVPSDALEVLREASAAPADVDALIAFAPWGGQPDNRVWSEDTLAALEVPTLLIAGNEDDVSNYDEGVRWLFDAMTGTDRHLLTFREARHNIAGNAFDLPEDAHFRAVEFLAEPVWRQDRIVAINSHFVTAFLDLHLKGEADKAAFLDVPTPDANDSEWAVSFGDQLNGKLAGEDEPGHWRGFQRRWALGLEMDHKPAGE